MNGIVNDHFRPLAERFSEERYRVSPGIDVNTLSRLQLYRGPGRGKNPSGEYLVFSMIPQVNGTPPRIRVCYSRVTVTPDGVSQTSPLEGLFEIDSTPCNDIAKKLLPKSQ